ncbi:MAG: hypothetical protein HYZ28_22160 [Myxococcales bacterium]|nr:hypothetical protein [Myxococcales bacterium]
MQFGFEYCGVSPAKMTVSDFEEVVFRIFPRKVSVGASQAGEIVDELRAFWRFVDREFGLKNAAQCLAALDDQAVKKLERKLSDPSNFGLAKSFVMAGQEAGFDTDTEEGLQQWVAANNVPHLDMTKPSVMQRLKDFMWRPEKPELVAGPEELEEPADENALRPMLDLQSESSPSLETRLRKREERRRKRKLRKASQRRNR